MARDINPFGLRMSPELRAKVEDAAREGKRSLNAEICSRLDGSFLGRGSEGLPDTDATVAAVLQSLERQNNELKKDLSVLAKLVYTSLKQDEDEHVEIAALLEVDALSAAAAENDRTLEQQYSVVIKKGARKIFLERLASLLRDDDDWEPPWEPP